jgi:Mor family transcriptional regulator
MIEEDVQLEDLPEEFREIAEVIGLDRALGLADYINGAQVYIPKKDTIVRRARYRRMLADYEECRDYGQVAKKYNLSESHARMLIKKFRLEANPPQKQQELF